MRTYRLANQDRHHANWAAIEEQDGTLRLAPTFDHAAGLARNLRDDERKDRLQTSLPARSITTFATKAKSACYLQPTDQRTLSTFDCLLEFGKEAPNALANWQDRLLGVSENQILDILCRIPKSRMSETTRHFTLQLLLTNQQRILELRLA
jgi:hypothetical protein